MWRDILLAIIAAAVPALCMYGLNVLSKYLSAKTQNAAVQQALSVATGIVQQVVGETTQTFVKTLKGTDQWNTDAMQKAFDQSKRKAKMLISGKVRSVIEDETGNFDEWLKSQIENTVRMQ